MRILVVAPGPKFSTFDTYTYYFNAFRKLGHEVLSFSYHDVFAFAIHGLASLNDIDLEEENGPVQMHMKAASLSAEYLISRIVRTRPDLVFVVSGIALPHDVWDWINSLRGDFRHPFKTAVFLTESPYEEELQRPLLENIDYAFTTDLSSLTGYEAINPNSMYVRHAFDPSVHRKMPPREEYATDVFVVGTGFPERIALLRSVDWDGIKLRVFGGYWDDVPELKEYVSVGFLDNAETVPWYYSNAKICPNIFRTAKLPGDEVDHIADGEAYSLSPRCYEVLGCGGFLLTNYRPELDDLFDVSRDLVVYNGEDDFSDKIRYYLSHDREREAIALSGWMAVRDHTYQDRARQILEFIGE